MNLIKTGLLSLLPFMLLVACGKADPDPREVLDREQERIEYLRSADYDRLESLLSPELSYTHSNGSIDNREEFMGALRRGEVIYRNLNHQDVELRFVTPKVAVINGISDVSVTVAGEDREVPLRFTIVYVKRGGEWFFEAWHSVSRPG